MIKTVVDIAVGVALGWFFLPTPAWATAALGWIVSKVPFVGKYVK